MMVTIGDGDHFGDGDFAGGRCEDPYDGAEEASRGRRGGGPALQIHHTLRISYGQ